jgi:hypothetical protein
VTLLLAIAVACAPPPPTEAQAVAWAEALDARVTTIEVALATEVDAKLPAFVCHQGDLPVRPTEPICIEQKSAWERKRLATVAGLQPALTEQLAPPVVGIGLLVAGVGSVSVGERPTPAVTAEQGPRQGLRWLGWGADRGGPFVETVRKMSVGDNDLAIRIVARPAAGP